MITKTNLAVYFVVCFFLALPAAHGEEKTLAAEFIGNSAFQVTDGDHTLVTDFPYHSGAYDSMTYEFDFAAAPKNTTALISHRHEDHFDPFLFIEQDWKIIGPQEVTVALAQKDVVAFNSEISHGPFTVTPVKTPHGNTEHYSYLVTWQGKKLFFTGDTGELAALQDLPDLNALFITPWLYRKALAENQLPETREIIIYHHREDEIIPDCAACLIPVQGQRIAIK